MGNPKAERQQETTTTENKIKRRHIPY